MPGDLYEIDVLSWSERQAALLRRLAVGEKVNAEIDWPHVIEELEDVGQSELRAVRSLLARALEHLLKMHGWPSGSREQWRSEALSFLIDARRSWTPSMGGRISLDEIYEETVAVTRARTVDAQPPGSLPDHCPFSLDELIVARPRVPDLDELLAKLV
jgi:Domain of unknown function DUF29